MPRRRSAPLAALSCTVMLLLASCSEADDADSSGAETTTSAASSAAPSPSPSPTPSAEATSDEYVQASADGPAQNVPKPVKPALADEESYEGAQAFLDYLADARAYAWQTGDTSLVREITEDECIACIEQYDEIDALYVEGGWAEAGTDSITIFDKDMPVNSYGMPAPRVKIKSPEVTVWGAGGEVEQKSPAIDHGDRMIYAHLNHADAGWSLVLLTAEAM